MRSWCFISLFTYSYFNTSCRIKTPPSKPKVDDFRDPLSHFTQCGSAPPVQFHNVQHTLPEYSCDKDEEIPSTFARPVYFRVPPIPPISFCVVWLPPMAGPHHSDSNSLNMAGISMGKFQAQLQDQCTFESSPGHLGPISRWRHIGIFPTTWLKWAHMTSRPQESCPCHQKRISGAD